MSEKYEGNPCYLEERDALQTTCMSAEVVESQTIQQDRPMMTRRTYSTGSNSVLMTKTKVAMPAHCPLWVSPRMSRVALRPPDPTFQ